MVGLFDLQGCYYSVKLGTWASTTIKIMVDPISMINTLRVQQWWYINTHCFIGGWNLKDKVSHTIHTRVSMEVSN